MCKSIQTISVVLFLMGGLGCSPQEKGEADGSAGSPVKVLPASEESPTLETGLESENLRFLLVSRFPQMPYKLDSITSDGFVRIRVQIPEQIAPGGISAILETAMFTQLTEGYYLGLSGLPASERMMVFEDIRRGTVAIDGARAFRVQVTQVEERGQAVLRIGPAAKEHLKKGDTFCLVRPAGSITSQLQAMPDLVPVTDGIMESIGTNLETAASLNRSKNNLKQIAAAMHNFHDTYRRFPPAVIYGPDGKPWHSWRVLLLPFLEQQALYDQYRFDEPWDGPNNSKLLKHVPPVYQDPIYGETDDSYTHYAVAVGEQTAFPPKGYTLPENASVRSWNGGNLLRTGALAMRDILDGTSYSLLVGSVSPERRIPWLKPEDVVFDERFPGIGELHGFAAPYETTEGAGGVFVFADGSVHTIREDIDMEQLRNLIQIADGQVIGNFPTLEPARRSRSQQVLVLQISGAVAKLTTENLRPVEDRIFEAPGAPPVPGLAEGARKAHSMNNLKQLESTVHNDHPRDSNAGSAELPPRHSPMSSMQGGMGRPRAKLKINAPEVWTVVQPKSPMIQAEFALPKVESDENDGRLTVMMASGSIEANVKRWRDQFEGLEAKPVQEIDLSGTKVTLVDFSGTFKEQRGMMGPVTKRPNYRMLAAILQRPEGLLFVKGNGPANTMAKHAEDFSRFVQSLASTESDDE